MKLWRTGSGECQSYCPRHNTEYSGVRQQETGAENQPQASCMGCNVNRWPRWLEKAGATDHSTTGAREPGVFSTRATGSCNRVLCRTDFPQATSHHSEDQRLSFQTHILTSSMKAALH